MCWHRLAKPEVNILLLLQMQAAQSVVTITQPIGKMNGRAVPNGLYDPALGTMDPKEQCATCLNTYKGVSTAEDCPGHFGMIEVGRICMLRSEMSAFQVIYKYFCMISV